MSAMWRNYLTVGVRALTKNRTYAFITVCGLAIGMAACLMILLFVRYERSYDGWLPNAENIYQVQSWYESKDTGERTYLQMTPYASGAALKKDFPQIDTYVYLLSSEPVFLSDGRASLTKDFHFTDGNLLDVVPLSLASGSRDALDRAGGALITRSEARKRYGTEHVVGRMLSVISKGITWHFRIGGVLEDLPKNSHMRISTVARLDFASYFATEPKFLSCWACQSGWIYASLKRGSDPREIEAALPAWEKRNIKDESSGEAHFNAGDDQQWKLVNVRDVHLGRGQTGAMAPGNDQLTIITFAIIALLILGMAVVNFTNLATARASQRAREVALRKVLGANRSQLVVQFVGESLLVAALAMLVALALVEALMPAYAAFLDADLTVRYFGAGGVALYVLLLVVLVGVLGGLYPAFVLARFQPASVLKANRSSAETPGSGRLRGALVVGQFAVSIGLIICTAIVYAQTVYARTLDPGYQRANILQVDGLNRAQLMNSGQRIVDRMRQVPGVEAIGRTGIGVATMGNSNTNVMVPGNSKPVLIGQYAVDEGFFGAMGLALVAGRWFDAKLPMDDMTLRFPLNAQDQTALAARGANVVINELAARRLGFGNAAEAVGKQVRGAVVESEYGLVPLTIVGVVRDARFRSIKLPLDPIMFQNADSGHQYLMLRYRGDPAAARAGVERAWKRITSEVPFEAKFSEDIIDDLYEAEDARAKSFAAFALLAVIVACLGLFGLAAFTAERRTKEIGIRKILGASTQDIVRLLAWQFSKPVLLANIIAWPIAWWVMRDWLSGFDARIPLGPLPFVAAALLALAIAIGTIAGHAFRVARANPIHALRYE